MARIPVANQFGGSPVVAVRGVFQDPRQYRDASAPVAAGLAQVTKALEVIDRRRSERLTKEADMRTVSSMTDLMTSPEKDDQGQTIGFLARTGNAVLEGRSGALAALQAVIDREEEGLAGNAIALAMYRNASVVRLAAATNQVNRYTIETERNLNDAVSKARIAQQLEIGAANFMDEKVVLDAIATGMTELDQRREFNNWPPEVYRIAEDTFTSNMWEGVVRRMMEVDPIRAQELYDRLLGKNRRTARAVAEDQLGQGHLPDWVERSIRGEGIETKVDGEIQTETVRTESYERDGKILLVPTIRRQDDGTIRRLTPEEAQDEAERLGDGIEFPDEAAATRFSREFSAGKREGEPVKSLLNSKARDSLGPNLRQEIDSRAGLILSEAVWDPANKTIYEMKDEIRNKNSPLYEADPTRRDNAIRRLDKRWGEYKDQLAESRRQNLNEFFAGVAAGRITSFEEIPSHWEWDDKQKAQKALVTAAKNEIVWTEAAEYENLWKWSIGAGIHSDKPDMQRAGREEQIEAFKREPLEMYRQVLSKARFEELEARQQDLRNGVNSPQGWLTVSARADKVASEIGLEENAASAFVLRASDAIRTEAARQRLPEISKGDQEAIIDALAIEVERDRWFLNPARHLGSYDRAYEVKPGDSFTIEGIKLNSEILLQMAIGLRQQHREVNGENIVQMYLMLKRPEFTKERQQLNLLLHRNGQKGMTSQAQDLTLGKRDAQALDQIRGSLARGGAAGMPDAGFGILGAGETPRLPSRNRQGFFQKPLPEQTSAPNVEPKIERGAPGGRRFRKPLPEQTKKP